jgi:hypothetical protein
VSVKIHVIFNHATSPITRLFHYLNGVALIIRQIVRQNSLNDVREKSGHVNSSPVVLVCLRMNIMLNAKSHTAIFPDPPLLMQFANCAA